MRADQELHAELREIVLALRVDHRGAQRKHVASMRRVRDAGQQSSVYFLNNYAYLVQDVAACDRWLARNQP